MHFADSLTKVRQSLSTPKLISQDDSSKNLSELLSSLIMTTVEKIKGVLRDLMVICSIRMSIFHFCSQYVMFQVFIQPEINFAQKPQFRDSFCIDNVREGLIVCFMHHLTATARGFCSLGTSDSKTPPTLLLLLSKFCLEFRNGSVHFLVK